MIDYHIEAAQRINKESDDYKIEVFLTGSFKEELFKSFCDYWFTNYDQEIKYLKEPNENMGTAGGLLYFEKQILGDSSPDTKIMVMNADICSSFPLTTFLKFHESCTRKGGRGFYFIFIF